MKRIDKEKTFFFKKKTNNGKKNPTLKITIKFKSCDARRICKLVKT